jgi:hypothetical protein
MCGRRVVSAPVIHFVAVAALLYLAGSVAACNKPPQEDTPTVPEFQKRIDAYMDLQRNVIGGLPALKNTDEPKEITAREVAMGEAVRRARASAKQGDIIVPETATYFRKLIQEDLQSRTPAEKKVMKDELPPFEPVVNQTYPSEHPLATFPATLLKILPTLPEELEYRFLSDALIIRDVKTNIIIDYITNVF